MKFLDIPNTKLELNRDTRDYALLQLLIQTGVNQRLLMGIYGEVFSQTPQQVQSFAKEVEGIESAYVYEHLGQYATSSSLAQLSRPPSPTHEEPQG